MPERHDFLERLTRGLERAREPSLVRLGRHCTPELTRETARRIPGAQAVIMPELGHFPMSENPERFRTHLLPVLERLRERLAAPPR
jgi:pimeloyl-ACP methyl ester carboxylesterase